MTQAESNITYRDGQLWEVRCRGCNTPIRKMVVADDFSESKTINGKLVTFQRLRLACLNNYREVLMACTDGSAHVACMCATCADSLTSEKAQIHHDLDVEEMGLHTSPVIAGRVVGNIAAVAPQIGAV